MKYKHGRPKGWAEWKPRENTRIILQQVEEILEQYKDYWPLSLRQIFYRLSQYMVMRKPNGLINVWGIIWCGQDGLIRDGRVVSSAEGSPGEYGVYTFADRAPRNGEHYYYARIVQEPESGHDYPGEAWTSPVWTVP